MAIITIQCRLQAKEETLRYLWRLMVEQNTLLVSETLEPIKIHPELDLWLERGYIPDETINSRWTSFPQGDLEENASRSLC